MSRKRDKMRAVSFKADAEMVAFLNSLSNASDVVRRAVLNHSGMTCPLCRGAGVQCVGVVEHYLPILDAHPPPGTAPDAGGA